VALALTAKGRCCTASFERAAVLYVILHVIVTATTAVIVFDKKGYGIKQ
jgi:hypothetical protein